jgi:hypothetical protein
MPTTETLIHESTLGPLTAAQRTEIMSYATFLQPEARRVFRRLLIVSQTRGVIESDVVARAAAQARAHFEGI